VTAHDLIVIGGGVMGVSAALRAATVGMSSIASIFRCSSVVCIPTS
jgi:thioredoxin reductase